MSATPTSTTELTPIALEASSDAPFASSLLLTEDFLMSIAAFLRAHGVSKVDVDASIDIYESHSDSVMYFSDDGRSIAPQSWANNFYYTGVTDEIYPANFKTSAVLHLFLDALIASHEDTIIDDEESRVYVELTLDVAVDEGLPRLSLAIEHETKHEEVAEFTHTDIDSDGLTKNIPSMLTVFTAIRAQDVANIKSTFHGGGDTGCVDSIEYFTESETQTTLDNAMGSFAYHDKTYPDGWRETQVNVEQWLAMTLDAVFEGLLFHIDIVNDGGGMAVLDLDIAESLEAQQFNYSIYVEAYYSEVEYIDVGHDALMQRLVSKG